MYKKDFNYRYNKGKEAESAVLPLIIEYFKRDIKPTTNKLDRFDFTCSNYKYELKSRNNIFSKYPTTMIAVDKLEENVILLFNTTRNNSINIRYNYSRNTRYRRSIFISRFVI